MILLPVIKLSISCLFIKFTLLSSLAHQEFGNCFTAAWKFLQSVQISIFFVSDWFMQIVAMYFFSNLWVENLFVKPKCGL